MKLLLLLLYPFRLLVVRMERGSLLRKICVATLKIFKGKMQISVLLNEVRPLDAPQVTFEAVNSMVLDDIYWFGLQGYEGRLADVWVTLCQQADDILEIGGNIGVFTIIGGKVAKARYTVLEPVPVNAAILRRNLLRNRITTVTVLEAAAVPGPEDSKVHLNIPIEGRDAPVGAHLTVGVEVNGRSSESIIPVEGLSFKRLIKSCDLIKIDAEGIEAELLSSVFSEIILTKPTLIIEVLPEAKQLGELIARISQIVKYNIYIIPAYGINFITKVDPESFTSTLPKKYFSKDVVLSTMDIK